ncbi:Dabb family protein [Dysgonomonas sp. Marseille-P4677]|uniref:Dabb family protein n=1 Tax=Dysgonomonas sp. Marseille-P4677 TaxID=2364790 RepID=UPI001911B2EF|nr:Dabb family protein [Dysgonomonas sp. Marseille-P4677]MBK5719595.1 Dabb family protein [Dysgonomonas sp. Marseille-P4677]
MDIRIIGLLFISCLFFSCNRSGDDSQKNQVEISKDSSVRLEKGNIKHTVMFNLQYDSDSSEAKTFLQDGQRILSALPMVKNFEVFRQVSSKNGYQFYFSMIFEDQTAYQAYNEHPEHVRFVKERWEKEVTDFLEADFVNVE